MLYKINKLYPNIKIPENIIFQYHVPDWIQGYSYCLYSEDNKLYENISSWDSIQGFEWLPEETCKEQIQFILNSGTLYNKMPKSVLENFINIVNYLDNNNNNNLIILDNKNKDKVFGNKYQIDDLYYIYVNDETLYSIIGNDDIEILN